MAISNNSTGLRPGVCTSTTRPTNAYIGQMIFETDTFVLKYWNGTTWQSPVSVPVGTVEAYAGSTTPAGWLLAYGQTVSRTTYADLFTAIGTTHGAGDGSTTFTLPDMRGRAIAGKDDMGGSAASRITAGVTGVTGTTLGSAGGNQNAASHTHTFTGNAASHTHIQDAHTHTNVLNSAPNGTPFDGAKIAYGSLTDLASRAVTISSATATNQSTSLTPTGTVGTTFSGTSANLQPTIILNYIIKF